MIPGFALLALATLLSRTLPDLSPAWWQAAGWIGVLEIIRAGRRWTTGIQPRQYVAAVFAWGVWEAANLRLHEWYYISFPSAGGFVVWLACGFPIVMAIVLLEPMVPSLRLRLLPALPPLASVGIGLGLGVTALVAPAAAPLVWFAPLFVLDGALPALNNRPAEGPGSPLQNPNLAVRLVGAAVIVALIQRGLDLWFGPVRVATPNSPLALPLADTPPWGWIGLALSAPSAYVLYQVGVRFVTSLKRITLPFDRYLRLVPVAVVSIGGVAVLWFGAQDRLVTSTVPAPLDLAAVRAVGHLIPEDLTVGDIVEAGPQGLADQYGVQAPVAFVAWHQADLAMLSGIGARHVEHLERMGIHTACDFESFTSREIWVTIHGLFRGLGPRPTPAETANWKRAADQHCASVRHLIP